MWSIGNEIPERLSDAGLEYSWRLANEVHRLDPTRPVTAAIHAFPGRPVLAGEMTARRAAAGVPEPAATVFLDVVGYNYKLQDIERDHALYPQRLFYGSETFPHDAYGYRELGQRAPYMLGEFVWTAMDYVGEAGIGLSTFVPTNSSPFAPIEFPVVISNCGDIDLVGNQKAQSRFRDIVWGVSQLEVAVQRPLADGIVERVPQWGWRDELQSWNWPDIEAGHPLTVHIYTVGDRVELKVNGRVLDSRRVAAADKMQVDIDVPYEPGSLEVIAYRNGAGIARRLLATTSVPAKLRITPERISSSSAICRADLLAPVMAKLSPTVTVKEVANPSGPALKDGARYTASKTPLATTPLCKFPEMVHCSGHGGVKEAANWSCPANDHSMLRIGESGRQAGVIE